MENRKLFSPINVESDSLSTQSLRNIDGLKNQLAYDPIQSDLTAPIKSESDNLSES